ncbi:MAG: hypothetical protein H7321_03075 [Bacteroidia bacterium]|nr:hypothetical protein [Bacteroidia bacterium]
MKLLLDLPDNKAAQFMEMLKNLPYIKTKKLSEEKALILTELKEAAENVILVKKGKLKARPAADLLNEI